MRGRRKKLPRAGPRLHTWAHSPSPGCRCKSSRRALQEIRRVRCTQCTHAVKARACKLRFGAARRRLNGAVTGEPNSGGGCLADARLAGPCVRRGQAVNADKKRKETSELQTAVLQGKGDVSGGQRARLSAAEWLLGAWRGGQGGGTGTVAPHHIFFVSEQRSHVR